MQFESDLTRHFVTPDFSSQLLHRGRLIIDGALTPCTFMQRTHTKIEDTQRMNPLHWRPK